MAKLAVVQSGGKQYLVKENDQIVVDNIKAGKDSAVELQTLAIFDTDKDSVDLGLPELKKKISAKVLESGKGEKLHIERFKAKVRYRKAKGFRQSLTKVQIVKI